MGFFFTGKGDSGESELWDGKKLDKSGVGAEALGSLDELNSLLGILRSNSPRKDIILSIQEDLFSIQAIAYLAIISSPEKYPPFGEDKISAAEKIINEIETRLSPERSFVIPGENEGSAWLDFARAISRRAERNIIRLHKETPLPENVLRYMNRLSSLLFALARAAATNKESKPSYK